MGSADFLGTLTYSSFPHVRELLLAPCWFQVSDCLTSLCFLWVPPFHGEFWESPLDDSLEALLFTLHFVSSPWDWCKLAASTQSSWTSQLMLDSWFKINFLFKVFFLYIIPALNDIVEKLDFIFILFHFFVWDYFRYSFSVGAFNYSICLWFKISKNIWFGILFLFSFFILIWPFELEHRHIPWVFGTFCYYYIWLFPVFYIILVIHGKLPLWLWLSLYDYFIFLLISITFDFACIFEINSWHLGDIPFICILSSIILFKQLFLVLYLFLFNILFVVV